jgi:prepilin-type processing-associated H-X9-DG protein
VKGETDDEPTQHEGLTRVEVVAVVLVGLILLASIIPILRHVRNYAFRAACRNNLAAIGKAMLLYANDHNGELPCAGGRSSTWGPLANWMAPNRTEAFGLDPQGGSGTATISSCFYLLVKYMEMEPGRFVCPGDAGTTELKLSDVPSLREGFTLTDAWDFAPGTSPHCSYAYQMPFCLYALQTSDDPSRPVAADRNPWIESPTGLARDLSAFIPDLPSARFTGTPETARNGNCSAHKRDGQNVLFLDGHVSFEKRSYCGPESDNIYLVSRNMDRGDEYGVLPTVPTPAIQSRKDSVLVHDPSWLTPRRYAVDTAAQAIETDSRDLQRTAVVATLDCPLPEHKNAIWCSTLQMAWDKFKKDLIRAPIQVRGAEELANRLNRLEFPTNDIEAKSYYVAAGFVKEGIIEQIRKDMARQFPSEPAPVFDERYKTLPRVATAYAYLNVGVGFQLPYYTYLRRFDFADSNGLRAGVTAFCAQTSERSADSGPVREQVEVLYYDDGRPPETAQFAVDLSKGTEPYQVILALMARRATLGEAAASLREKAAAFKNDPGYEVLRKLRPVDTLVVPDVVYRLTHHFDELLGKFLGNAGWQDASIFDAVQKIDFTLSRTGVVLRSAARMGTTASRSAAQLAKPRHLHFDRPFLICVRKREPEATPFFLMWVNNAELMKKYADQDRR